MNQLDLKGRTAIVAGRAAAPRLPDSWAAKTAIFDQATRTRTDYAPSKSPSARFVTADETASTEVWLGSEDRAFSTGSVHDISGGSAA